MVPWASSPYLVTGVYIGYDQVAPMGRFETGGRAALPVFVTYRQGIDHLYQPTTSPCPPASSTAVWTDERECWRGRRPHPSYMLPFILGTQPSATSGEALERGEDDVQRRRPAQTALLMSTLDAPPQGGASSTHHRARRQPPPAIFPTPRIALSHITVGVTSHPARPAPRRKDMTPEATPHPAGSTSQSHRAHQ